jgi:hypothetical protein
MAEKHQGKFKSRKLTDALWNYWRDKPRHMSDVELMEQVIKSKLTPEDIARMVRDYNKVLGPDVGTCVCVLCNDFATENEGTFKPNAKDVLDDYKVGCTKDEYEALTSLGKRFRHIVNFDNGNGTGKDPVRYFISALGLQEPLKTEKGKVVPDKWIWHDPTDARVLEKGCLPAAYLSTARVFVCDECVKTGSGPKRRLKSSDPGRMPQWLKDNPLNMAEEIVMNEVVIFNTIALLDVVKKNHLSGHVIAIDTRLRNDKPCKVQLPRMEYSDHIKLAFFGKDGTKKIAFDLMRKMRRQSWTNVVVRPKVVEKWMELLEMKDELAHFRERKAEYKLAWKAQEQKIERDSIESDDKVQCEMRRRGVAHYAKARPPLDPNDDDARHGEAAPGISHILVNHQDTEGRANQFLRSMRKVLTPERDEAEETSTREQPIPTREEIYDMDDKLGNEFTHNDKIIYKSFGTLLPLGAESNLIPEGSVSVGVTRRLMRFADPRFARNARFRNFLFSQQMRHGMCQRVAKLRKAGKLQKLQELIKEEGFAKKLLFATSSDHNSKTPRGRELIDKLMPYFRDTTGALKWSTLERQASKSEMLALTLAYGAGGYFFTVSPGMKDQRFAMRLMQRLRSKSDKWGDNKKDFPTTDGAREKLHSENPVESARVYDMLARAFYSKLVCSGLANGVGGCGYRNSAHMKENMLDKKGAFGYTQAVYGVTEAQGTGGLHTHGIGFQFILGMALKRFAGDKTKTTELRKVYETIESHVSAMIDPDIRKDILQAKNKNKSKRNWVDQTTPMPPELDDCACAVCGHRSAATCPCEKAEAGEKEKSKRSRKTAKSDADKRCTCKVCKERTESFFLTAEQVKNLEQKLREKGFADLIEKDAMRTNAWLNRHATCSRNYCLAKKGSSGTCRFGILKREMDCTACSELVPNPDDRFKVVGRRGHEIRKPVDTTDAKWKDWPLTPDSQIRAARSHGQVASL